MKTRAGLGRGLANSSIEKQVQWLFGIRVSLLELRPRQPARERHHGVLHVQHAPLLLVDMRRVNDQPLETIERQ